MSKSLQIRVLGFRVPHPWFLRVGLGFALVVLTVTTGASAQDPILTPVVTSEVGSAVVSTITKPRPAKPAGTQKFQGYFVNGNIAQITLRAKGNDMAIQTFPLSQDVSAKMQKIVDKGGYQYGDKVTVYFDPQTHQALKVKGKPSRPL
jgi:hypothetical protein